MGGKVRVNLENTEERMKEKWRRANEREKKKNRGKIGRIAAGMIGLESGSRF